MLAHSTGAITAIRGAALTFKGDPFLEDAASCMRYESDAIVVMADGHIIDFGPAGQVTGRLRATTRVTHYADALITAGFIDAHVHYAQTEIIASYGKQLLDWLDDYTFPAEQAFADTEHARRTAKSFLQECLRAGTTTSAVFCTVHPGSVDAFFEEAEALGMRMLAGKVLMDRNAPEALRDTPQSGYDDSKAALLRWHGRGRLLYYVTPRFAPTTSPAQLDAAGALWREHPGTYLQSHIAENRNEVAWVQELFPAPPAHL